MHIAFFTTIAAACNSCCRAKKEGDAAVFKENAESSLLDLMMFVAEEMDSGKMSQESFVFFSNAISKLCICCYDCNRKAPLVALEIEQRWINPMREELREYEKEKEKFERNMEIAEKVERRGNLIKVNFPDNGKKRTRRSK